MTLQQFWNALRFGQRARELRQQMIQARTLNQQLPVPWLSFDTQSGLLLDCNSALSICLGYAVAERIGKPVAALFQTTNPTMLLHTLCRPAHTGAAAGVALNFLHHNGQVVKCIADGVLQNDAGLVQPSAPRVLWIFYQQRVLQSGGQTLAAQNAVTDAPECNWTLEAERERREQSLRWLNVLRQGLYELRDFFQRPTDERAKTCVNLAWQAAEKAAIALAAPHEGIRDLFSALQQLTQDLSANTPGSCVFECIGTPGFLSDKAKRVAFRTSQDFLLQMLDASKPGKMTLQVETTEQGFMRFRLIRLTPLSVPVMGVTKSVNLLPKTALPSTGLGLFGTKTLLAGVGGTLAIAPGQHDTIFAEFQLPLSTVAQPAT